MNNLPKIACVLDESCSLDTMDQNFTVRRFYVKSGSFCIFFSKLAEGLGHKREQTFQKTEDTYHQ